jgi:hypothetical protein
MAESSTVFIISYISRKEKMLPKVAATSLCLIFGMGYSTIKPEKSDKQKENCICSVHRNSEDTCPDCGKSGI